MEQNCGIFQNHSRKWKPDATRPDPRADFEQSLLPREEHVRVCRSGNAEFKGEYQCLP